MSFTAQVKDEISHINNSKLENISIISAMVSSGATIEEKYIKINTENNSVARLIYTVLVHDLKVIPKITVRRGYNFNKRSIYILEVKNNVELLSILGINGNHISSFVIADEELIKAYLRGLFLISGSINDPKTARYHLEFVLNTQEFSKFILKLLNKFRLNAKMIMRDNKYMIYIKEAEKIGDYLRIIGASNSLFYFEDIRIYRDHKNMTNRLNNCEQANVDKTVMVANEQIKDINLLIENYLYDLLDEKVKLIANYRKKYPYYSLNELANIISLETGETITKSGVNHRMNKIKELANKIRNSKK